METCQTRSYHFEVTQTWARECIRITFTDAVHHIQYVFMKRYFECQNDLAQKCLQHFEGKRNFQIRDSWSPGCIYTQIANDIQKCMAAILTGQDVDTEKYANWFLNSGRYKSFPGKTPYELEIMFQACNALKRADVFYGGLVEFTPV
jgi:hypothetical protein